MFSAGIKAIPKRSLAFFEDCAKQYGAVFFVCYALKTSKGVESGIMDYTRNMAGNGRSFTAKMKNEIAESGIQELWEGYVNSNWGIMEAEQEEGITRRMGKKKTTMHLNVNQFGEPILPDVDRVVESGEVPAEFQGVRDYLQTTLRVFLSTHWGLAGPVTSKEPTVPWAAILQNPREYIHRKYLPDNLLGLLKEPSKVVIGDCLALLAFWLSRQRRGKDVVFEFSHWRQSRFKSPVPREPRREVLETPLKPGCKVSSGEGSGGESGGIETRLKRSKCKAKAKAKAPVEWGDEVEWGADEESDEESDEEESDEVSDEEEPDEVDSEEESDEVESDRDSGEGDLDNNWVGWADEWQGVQAPDSSSDSEHQAPPPAFGGQGSKIPPPLDAEDDSSDSGASSSESSVPPPAFGGQGSRIPPPLFTDRGSSEDEGSMPPAIGHQEVPPSFSESQFYEGEDQHRLDFDQDAFEAAGSSRDSGNGPNTTEGLGRKRPNDGGDIEDSDNPSDVDKISHLGAFKTGPPKKKQCLANCKGESVAPSKPQPAPAYNPQESPVKNTGHTVKPRPRKVPVAGTPDNLDRRFDRSNQRQTRSPTKPPGHYARLNRGATPPSHGRPKYL